MDGELEEETLDSSILELEKEDSKHPLLEDFLLQYPRCWEEAADRAFLVYQDLTEARGWWFTQMSFSEQLERPYVMGQETRKGKQQVVLPLGMEEQVSTRDIQAFLSNRLGMRPANDEILLAINDLDSTVVYYKLWPGFHPPDHPDVVAEKKYERNERMDKKRQHIAACVRKAMERLNREDT